MRFVSLSVIALGLSAACGPYVTRTPVSAPSPAGTPIRYATRPDSTRLAEARLVSLDAERLVFEQWTIDPAGLRGAWAFDSVATPSLATLQVRVGRRGNAGPGALIGAAVGLGLGVACASEDSWIVSDEACMAGYTLLGTGTGTLIGLLVRSDVWAPAAVPSRAPETVEPSVTMR
jgi:hypothetical protein